MPGQWPGSSPSSSSGRIENEDLQAGSDDGSSQTPDLALVSELLESIERHPPGQEARVLLMQHYAMCGWHDAAKEEAHQVLEIDGTDTASQRYLSQRGKHEAGKKKGKAKLSENDIEFKDNGEPKWQSAPAPTWRPRLVPIANIEASMQELNDGYVALLENAKLCLKDTNLLQGLKAPGCETQISDLKALATGQVNSVVRFKPLKRVKFVAEAIVADSRDGGKNGLNIAVKDLEDLARWCNKSGYCADIPGKGKSRYIGDDDEDTIRAALVTRSNALKALLPKSLQPLAGLAVMHAEHEILHRKYINDETMLFDAVSDIPRANFWTSEDGYAWDMGELAGAITSGEGVMRNPLSKQMFTRADVRAIIQHPLGKKLQALRVEQSKLKRGLRSQTIDELDRLAKVLLEDMSEDNKPSHLAVEAFVSYLETLPTGEQKAIDNLKVPATDSHTGVAFDTSIGGAVRDVEANMICNHKAGDFLAQAVKYLK